VNAPIAVPTTPLTPREVQVLQQAAHGHTDQAITDLLDIGLRSVRQYMLNARQKLLAEDRREAVRIAIRLGLIH
jgi:DNA-binding CsgD family transcriptional regulator